jgi:hypothetical protein
VVVPLTVVIGVEGIAVVIDAAAVVIGVVVVGVAVVT